MVKETIPTSINPQATAAAPVAQAAATSMQPKKLFAIGIPVFIVQLVVVYFIAMKFIVPSVNSTSASAQPPSDVEKEASSNAEPNMYVIKDLIINPAGTNGNRFLLATIGFELSNPAALQELGKREIQVRDVLNTILTSKTLLELVDVSKRESLRLEIAKQVGGLVQSGKMKNVYFSKFIIQ